MPVALHLMHALAGPPCLVYCSGPMVVLTFAGIATGTLLTIVSISMVVTAGIAGSVAAFLGWGKCHVSF